jgi:hypothetical protein
VGNFLATATAQLKYVMTRLYACEKHPRLRK